MRARIHPGASEIGGNCVELEAGGSRLVLDIGRPLWAEAKVTYTPDGGEPNTKSKRLKLKKR